MNEVFRGAFGAKLGSDDVKNYAGDDSEVRFKPKPCFRCVLKDFDFSKNPDFFLFLGLYSPLGPLKGGRRHGRSPFYKSIHDRRT